VFNGISLTLVLLSIAQAGLAKLDPDPALGCKRNPAVVGDCITIRGRIFIANGTPSLRMWPVGTRRHYGIVPAEAEIVPGNVRRHVAPNRSVFGDFLVCPFTVNKPGAMLMVCVQEASNLVIQEYDDQGNRGRLSFDRSTEEVP
jgi:hypothetical protein